MSTTLDGPRLSPASGGRPSSLVVLLHGYGAGGADLIDIGRAWSDALPDAAFVAPDAPEHLPFEALAGRQWFPLAERDTREYRQGVASARPVLEEFLEAELRHWNVPGSALALVGFSQGAMMALHAGLRRPVPPAGLLAYSGLLADPAIPDHLAAHPPVLLVHGEDDDVVPAWHQSVAREALERAGVTVESHLLGGLDHGIDERGLVIGGRFLKAAFAAE